MVRWLPGLHPRGMRIRIIVAVLGFSGLFGCALAHRGEEAAAEGPVADPADGPVVRGTSPRAPRTCEVELVWADRLEGFAYGHHLIQMSPNGALAANTSMYGGQVVRTGDGAIFAGVTALSGMDASWRRAARIGDDGAIEVVDAATGEVIARSDLPAAPSADADWYRASSATVSADGSMAFALDCWSSGADDHEAIVRTWPVTEHASPREVPLGVGCTREWSTRRFVAPSDDGGDVVVVGLHESHVARVDARSGELLLARLAAGEPAEAARAFGPVDMTLSMDRAGSGGPVAVVTADARMHLLDGDTLEPLLEPRAVAVDVGNSHTYMPTVDSPVAIDAASDRMALVAEDGRVSIAQLSTGEEIGRIDAPFEEPTEPWSGKPNLPMGLRFGDGFLLVSYEGGMARVGCDAGRGAPASDTLVVRAAVDPDPTTAGAFAIHTYVEGTDEPVLRWIEGEHGPMSIASLAPELTTWAAAGTHTLRVVAHDGERTGATEVTFTVRETDGR